ncbi:MAG: hypothetical protein P1P89_02590 [Desulfobacterales bacterium]|nr:hypothetical protein [Desulfobacterales bacterium]
MQQWIMGADDQRSIDEYRSIHRMGLKEGPVWIDEAVSTVAASVTATGERKSAETFRIS